MSKVHGWRRPVRWARNIFLGIFGVLTVVLVGAYLFFETGYGRNVLRGQIESRMAAGFIGGATIGGLEGNPLNELVLKDVVINDADKQKAITIKRLTVKLPLMPLLSNQLRVDKIIADELDIRVRRDSQGKVNLANLRNPAEPSTWSVTLPNVEVHRGHVRNELGAEAMDIDNIEIFIDAKLPFAGPIDASMSLSADWRQKAAPIDVAASFHIDEQEIRVNRAAIQLADIDVAITELAMEKGPFMQPASGVVSVYAPEASLKKIAPQVNVPGDIGLLLTAAENGRLTDLTAKLAAGDSRVDVVATADIQAKLINGKANAERLDLTELTSGKLTGAGGARIAFDLDGNDPAAEFPTAHVNGTVWGQAGRAPATTATFALATGGNRASAKVTANTDGGLRANVEADIRKGGEHITLERAHVVAVAADAKRASQGLIPLRGTLNADIEASGAIAPRMDLAVNGHANGKRLRMQDISADSFALRINAKHLPDNPVGTARLEVADLQRGTMEFGKLTVAAGNRPDGKLQVTVRSQPKQAPWLIDLDALVTTGNTIHVDLQRHFVRAAGGTVWRGDTGTLTVSPREVALHNFVSRSGDGRIAADLTMVRAGRGQGNLNATVDANVDLSNLRKGYVGKVDAHVDVTRTGGRLAGVIDAKATGLAFNHKMRGAFNATVQVSAKADQLLANVAIDAPKVGEARIALDVDAPKNLADAPAWRKLGRDAIRKAELTFDGLNLGEAAKLAGAQQEVKGTIDGSVKLTPDTAGGLIKIRGVQVKQTRDLGTIEADVQVQDAGNGELRTTLTARLQPTEAAVAAKDVTQNGAARLVAEVRVKTPSRLFDPLAWRTLGANAFRGGTFRAERLAFQPGTLERLGIISDMRGELAVGAEIDPGMEAARFVLNVHRLQGGMFAQPIAINLSAILDEKSSRITGSVVGDNVALLKITGGIPVSLDELRANPDAAKTAPLAVTSTIDQVPARALLKVLGTTQVTGGSLDGKISVNGTVAKPTVDAKIVARNVSVPPEGHKPTQSIKEMTINANWDGTVARFAIDGTQSAGGYLKVRATANPDELAAATASLEAKRLDIAPLVAFMPGPAGALGGQLEADFKLKGADPRTADLDGDLHILNGRIPIAPAVGTLFEGDLKIGVHRRNVDLALKGKLGRGDVTLAASAPLDGATPKSGKLQLKLRKVQLIGTTEPIITGTINADVARVDEVWKANVTVKGMDIDLPEGKGTKLDPVGAPPDLVYGGEKIHHGKNKGRDVPKGIVHHDGPADFKPASQVENGANGEPNRQEPDAPVAQVQLKFSNVMVESKEVRGLLGGNLRITIADNREVGVVGRVAMSRAVLDLFSRRYQVDKANLMFDGSMDPVLDVRITHDFPEVTTITEVRGRMSKPQLILSSNPGQYSQAELLGFLLGGEPGGSPEDAPSATARVANAGASFIAGMIAAPIKKALPVDIDVLRYESASATNSAAVTVGTWITDSLFLAYRRHLEARPDENSGEGEVEYWIRRRLVLEAVAGDRGRHGLDLLWRRRW